MTLFGRREPPLPKAAVCFASPAMTRYAVDWLGKLGGCKPTAILSDDTHDEDRQSAPAPADLKQLAPNFTTPSDAKAPGLSQLCGRPPGKAGRAGKGGGAEAHRRLLLGGPDRPTGAGVAPRDGRDHAGRERPVKTDPAAASRGQKRGAQQILSMEEATIYATNKK